MASTTMKIEFLNKENFDTWKIQMEALLIKNDAWDYVNGEKKKPEIISGNHASIAAVKIWETEDRKAKSDIILAISPSELKQIKGCDTSREVWLKLKEIYQSKGPARKATLLKRLTLHRMTEHEDVREHLRKFFDTVDKLSEMEIEINPDLLSVLLLYSLPSSFENFRCAIESRDDLPSPETLRIKIAEESNARENNTRDGTANAMFVKKRFERRWNGKRENKLKTEQFRFRCHRCRKVGHKSAECNERVRRDGSANRADDVGLLAVANATRATEISETRNTTRDTGWCLDSGCTAHLCNSSDRFLEITEDRRGTLNLANNDTTEIKAKGTVSFVAKVNGQSKNVSVRDALYVPDLRTSLLSVGKITDKGFKVIFDSRSAKVVSNRNDVVLLCDRINGLYILRENERDVAARIIEGSEHTPQPNSMHAWHRRMGHLNFKDLLACERSGRVKGMHLKDHTEVSNCDICYRGKMSRTPFPKTSSRNSKLLEIIHSDVCGPMRTESNGKARYFITFIDDYSRWCEIRMLKGKHAVLDAFKEFKAFVENQTGKKIKYLQSDNGKEYCNTAFDDFLKTEGIGRRLTVTHTPEQNGVAERRNRTLMDMTRCLLMQSGMPDSFWGEAANTANYIRNRCPSTCLNGKTPFERWFGRVPNVSHFRDFGCEVHTLNRDPSRGKLDPRSKRGIFVGYAERSKGYRVWIPEERRVDITRDVKFVEKFGSPTATSPENLLLGDSDDSKNREIDFPARSIIRRNGADGVDGVNDVEDDQGQSEDGETRNGDSGPGEGEIESQNEPRRGRGRPRLVRTGSRGRPRKLFHSANLTNHREEAGYLTEVSIEEATRGSDADEWNDAIASELESILRNDTWQLVDRPERETVIGSRIVLRNKRRADGTLERRKARIVARGFAQRPGVDFDDTFAPVARIESIRILMALAAERGMNVEQLDVTTAYLNGVLNEKILMELPKHIGKGLEKLAMNESPHSDVRDKAREMIANLQSGDKVCLLNKSLYGLRQAGRCWNDRLCAILGKFGAKKSSADSCIFFKGHGRNLLIIATYVDDILVASEDDSEICRLKRFLSKEFDVKSLGRVEYCLGIEFRQDEDGISMSQRRYILDILERFGMSEAKSVSTPMDPNVRLSPGGGSDSKSEQFPYRELVGALMYVATCTRPDISFAVSYLSQFGTCHDSTHWTAAKRVLRYLKGSLGLGLRYRRAGNPVKGYVDADWANCPIDRRSYTGYAFILGGNPVAWESRKQRTVALSSTEAEYMALSEAAKQATYMQRFLKELEYGGNDEIVIFCDNNGARKIAENPVYHGRTKHIDVRHHYVREVLSRGILRVEYVSTDAMASDFLTKGVPATKLRRCLELLGLSSDGGMIGHRVEGEC
ncbi:Retrovirus-related Pol polyprotein from transposon TNT 1-94 [Anthophora plagiata]